MFDCFRYTHPNGESGLADMGCAGDFHVYSSADGFLELYTQRCLIRLFQLLLPHFDCFGVRVCVRVGHEAYFIRLKRAGYRAAKHPPKVELMCTVVGCLDFFLQKQ